MYEGFFGFHRRPFPSVPDTEFYFPAEGTETARQNLVRVIERGAGAGLVIGPAGSGKSLLCEVVAQQFRHQFAVAMLNSARLGSRRALLQNVLFELKLPYRDLDEGELRLSLIDHLDPDGRFPQGLLLIVDEAHTLPARLLEEIRMITNLARGGQPRVRLLLAGGPALEERLASPQLASFQQRVAARCYLHSMTGEETADYVQSQLRIAGRDKSLFTRNALRAIFRATDGVPRLVNQVCDHALVLACAGGVESIDEAGIEEAWADLQQLPTPRAAQSFSSGGASIIEFGSMADDDQVEGESQQATIEFGELSCGDESETFFADGVDEPQAEEDRNPKREWAAVETATAKKAASKAADPFGGSFHDEEIVVDNFASWESRRPRQRRVSSDEGRELAAALSMSVEDSLAANLQELQSTAERAIQSPHVEQQRLAAQQLLQQVYAAAYDELVREWWAQQATQQVQAVRGWPDDDRVLLIIGDVGEHDQRPGQPGPSTIQRLYEQR